MSYLLGSKAYMESLAADVQDLQLIIVQVMSRVGPVHAQSWKFPDKKACDLDIDDLLDLYDYDDDVDDPEAKQVGHIALYELVIDSVQFSTSQMETWQTTDMDMKGAGSVGLIIKQFWTQLVKIQAQHQQLLSENKLSGINMRDPEKESSKSSLNTIEASCISVPLRDMSMSAAFLETPGTLGLIPPNNADLVLMGHPTSLGQRSGASISRDANNKSCQTFESAFVPCESCDVIQRKLREAGEAIVQVCTDQGLPCSLKKFRTEVTHVEMLSFNDVCRWMAEQNKDVARIGKQSMILQSSINPLKSDVKTFETRTKTAEEKTQTLERNMKEETDARFLLCKQYESKLQDQKKHFTELIQEEERQKCQLKKNMENLEKEVAAGNCELKKHQDVLKELEVHHKRLESNLNEKTKDAEQALVLAKEVADLKSKLVDVTTALSSHSKTLAREQGKSKSAGRHNESLQAKQDNLLARMDMLGKENEELSHQVASLEEEKTALENTLDKLREETTSLDNRVKKNEIILKSLEKEKTSLERSMRNAETSIRTLEAELKEARERERMIVEYPDLNGPVNADIQGTGDVAVDMQNQITANAVRIKVLEEQNQTLAQSIHRLSAVRSCAGSKIQTEHSSVKLVPLWQPDSSLLSSQTNNSSYQPCKDWRQPEYNSEKMSPLHHWGNSESMDHPKHKQYLWSHMQKEADLVKGFQGPNGSAQPPDFLVSRGNTPQGVQTREDKSLRQGRQVSAKLSSVVTPVNATPIGAYTQMKKVLENLSGQDSSKKGRPPSGKQHASKTSTFLQGPDTKRGRGSSDDSSPPFCCPNCDKIYTKSQDLNIHLTYCSH